MLKMTVEKIDPVLAREYMKKNVNNPRGKKSLSRSVVKAYADDMTAGLWELNGEALVFDSDGFLKDGQHRLAAIIMSGKTIETAVIRGVDPNVNVFDIGWKRTIYQMVNSDSQHEFECNSSISSAAGLIVNNFKPYRSQAVHKRYIIDHYVDLERAYRITCYGGNSGSPKSKCASCIAATYLAIRTEAIRNYEMELFYRIFNNKNNYTSSGHDPSPALIAREMFDDRHTSNGYQIQKEKLEIITMGLLDFHEENHRTDHYKIAEPFHFQEWMSEVRRKDGLE